jgi:hypothetical protein
VKNDVMLGKLKIRPPLPTVKKDRDFLLFERRVSVLLPYYFTSAVLTRGNEF